jgi:hypothetical protein
MGTWMARNWWWVYGAIALIALALNRYTVRRGDTHSLLGREYSIAPERVLVTSGGAFSIILGVGIQLGLRTIDEVALATVGIGILLVAAGIFGGGRFGAWVIGGIALAGLVVFGAGAIEGH